MIVLIRPIGDLVLNVFRILTIGLFCFFLTFQPPFCTPALRATNAPGTAGSVSSPASVDAPILKTDPHNDNADIWHLSLEDAINRALEANRGLADAEDEVESARLSLQGAKSEFELKIFPIGDASISGGSDTDSVDSLGTGINIQKKTELGTDLLIGPNIRVTDGSSNTGIDTQLTQPLLRGVGKTFNLSAVHSAEFGVRTARRNRYLRQVNTVLATIAAVYDVVEQRELLKLNQESATRLKNHTEAAKAKKKIGLSNQIDVYRAGIQQKQAEDNLNTARQSYSVVLDNLKFLLALPLEKQIEIVAPLEYTLVRISESRAVGNALEKRVEVDQAKENISEATRLSKVAKMNIMPDLDLVVNYSRFETDDDFGNNESSEQDIWNISLVSSTDLFRTVEKVAYSQSLLNLQSAKRNYGLIQDEIIREVKRALRGLQASENSITIRKEQIRQSKEQLELARLKFRWGLADNFDVIDAETKLRTAQTDLLSSVKNYITSTSRLRAAMGTLLERPDQF